MGDLSGWLHEVRLRSQIVNDAAKYGRHRTFSVDYTPNDLSETILWPCVMRLGALATHDSLNAVVVAQFLACSWSACQGMARGFRWRYVVVRRVRSGGLLVLIDESEQPNASGLPNQCTGLAPTRELVGHCDGMQCRSLELAT